MIQSSWESNIGRLRIVVFDDEQLPRCLGLYFAEHHPKPKHWQSGVVESDWREHPLLWRVIEQLQTYFADGRFVFELPFEFVGTVFQRQVWQQLVSIPAGETRTYTEIAKRIGRPTAVRAVATAIAHNPLSIIVPCHRVVARNGALAGFAGGIERKRFLLEHEAV
jgi:methylated-DNA-[protein]-cysteine S-methyltransferase